MDIVKSIIVWFVGITYMIIMFPLTFFVWFIALPFDRNRTVTHWMLVYQGLILTRLMPVWTIRIEGRDKADTKATYVIISNHQSILDILLLNCLRYRYKWISKIENEKVPVLGWYIKMAGYITVDRGNDESKAVMLEKSLESLSSGISIMIFPEGTRSLNNETGFFKRGAFQLAIQSGQAILPVIIDGTGGVLPKHGFVFRGGNRIKIRVLDPVGPDSFGTDNPDELALKFSNFMKSALRDLRNG
ncbi:MAG: lysophospholipid acyltransferase family protein [Bacteroidales bacterium]